MRKYISVILLAGILLGLLAVMFVQHHELLTLKDEVRELREDNASLTTEIGQLREDNEFHLDKLDEERAKPKLEDLGEFKISHYNGDENEIEGGEFAFTGVRLREGHIAVDPEVIALGSTVYLAFETGETIECTAVDIGGAVEGKHIDLFRDVSAQELMDLGVKTARVYVKV